MEPVWHDLFESTIVDRVAQEAGRMAEDVLILIDQQSAMEHPKWVHPIIPTPAAHRRLAVLSFLGYR